ncbi:RNA-binding domain-containing protein [Fusobacterium sp. IOR10]|uniref:RNA-binding domain-containing protein n=1 Tax=Fusobacterium sp. IOR10 TaxID=2665157 RepID=UPI0013D0CD30|nr:RNA-binding domain-containing protein [Fusobacterium sp. IOR10]
MKDILEEIKKGESKTLEFKEILPNNKSIAKTVIAFSNAAGGKLIVGVTDKREIVGINEDIFEVKDKVISIIYESCCPKINPEIYTKNIDGKIILVIEVFKGSLVPYYLKAKGKEEGTYIRIGATNRVADYGNILNLERRRKNISYDEEIEYDVEYSKLDLGVLYHKFKKLGKEINEEKMLNMRLLKKDNEKIYPTKGLLILLGKYENVITKCSLFKGKNMSIFLDKKEYTGDLFSQLENIQIFIKTHLNLFAKIEGLQRNDYLEIPEVAIREALLNAMVHRDYSNEGRDIKVAIYEDRLEIISPGEFPLGISSENIYSGRSEIKNRVIAKVFKELNYIEQWGSGIVRILTLCEEYNLKKPKIEESGTFVGVTLFRKINTSKEIESTGKVLERDKSTGKVLERDKSTGKVLEPSQEEKILEYLKTNESIKKSEVEVLLKVKDSRARKILAEMVERGFIVKEGKGKLTHYKLKSEVE